MKLSCKRSYLRPECFVVIRDDNCFTAKTPERQRYDLAWATWRFRTEVRAHAEGQDSGEKIISDRLADIHMA